MMDTIFALSTGRLPAGIAVIRISGPGCSDAAKELGIKLPQPRRAARRDLRLSDGSLLDRALVLFFPGPGSVSGEDMMELHVHGGRAVVAKALEVLSGVPGLRYAEQGEFTRRGFLNGKLDLVEVEALADLIDAETEAQRRFAVLNTGVLQSQLYGGWRARLLYARAMLEAELDFSDEGDVPGSVSEAVWADMAALRNEMAAHIEGFARAEIVRDGFRVVLVGAPNAGKSSLMNALAKRDVAIVSPEPGTTRDVIEVNLDLNGYRVSVIDTAGLRDDAVGVEALGIVRTREQLARANLVLRLTPWDGERNVEAGLIAAEIVDITTKIDLVPAGHLPHGIAVSAQRGDGLVGLIARLAVLAERSATVRGDVLPSRERHVALFRTGIVELDRALCSSMPLELRAESLRLADREVGRVLGAVDAEDVLGTIFSTFCVGK